MNWNSFDQNYTQWVAAMGHGEGTLITIYVVVMRKASICNKIDSSGKDKLFPGYIISPQKTRIH